VEDELGRALGLATIYVEPHEWPKLGGLVYEHIDQITGLSVPAQGQRDVPVRPQRGADEGAVRRDGGQVPGPELGQALEYEDDDNTGARTTMACVGGSCD
jgi:hypothetical protein